MKLKSYIELFEEIQFDLENINDHASIIIPATREGEELMMIFDRSLGEVLLSLVWDNKGHGLCEITFDIEGIIDGLELALKDGGSKISLFDNKEISISFQKPEKDYIIISLDGPKENISAGNMQFKLSTEETEELIVKLRHWLYKKELKDIVM